MPGGGGGGQHQNQWEQHAQGSSLLSEAVNSKKVVGNFSYY
jgi:hypothetical protein